MIKKTGEQLLRKAMTPKKVSTVKPMKKSPVAKVAKGASISRTFKNPMLKKAKKINMSQGRGLSFTKNKMRRMK